MTNSPHRSEPGRVGTRPSSWSRCLRAVAALALSVVSIGAGAQTAVTITPPNLSGPVAGRVAGSSGVSPTGASRYTIPLAIPPGTADVAPQLSLEYSSQVGVGDIGYGWRIGGLSIISRCGRTMADDGSNEVVALTAADAFCLDGQRLKLVSGTHGATAEYRTKNDTFSQINATGTNPVVGPSKFVVRTKAGLTLTYANTADASIEAQGSSVVLAWALSRVEDRRGNYYTVAYTETNATGEFYPQQIRFTGNPGTSPVPYNAVNFIYQARPASDVVRGFAAGSLVTRSQRLSTIQTRINTAADGSAGVLVRDYRIAYTANPTNGRSLVSSVTDCDGVGNCLPASVFTWTQRDVAANTLQAAGSGTWATLPVAFDADTAKYGTKQQQVERGVLLIDVNGDGRADLVYSTGSGVWKVCLSTGTGFNCADWTGPSVHSREVVAGDFDGDGKVEFLVPPTNTGGTVGTWQRCRYPGTGTAFDCSTTFSAPSYGRDASLYMAGDFNADGRDDLVVRGDAPQYGGSSICLSTGTSFGACTNFGMSGLWTNNDPSINLYMNLMLAGDVNGDGRPDYVVFSGQKLPNGSTANVAWYVYLGTASGFGGSPSGSSPSQGQPVANATFAGPAPGLSRIGLINDDLFEPYGELQNHFGQQTSPVYETCTYTGTQLACAAFPTDNSVNVREVADFDGDGRAEVRVDDTKVCPLSPWTGQRITPAGDAVNACTVWAAGSPPTGYERFGDFNGDGLTDSVIYVEASGTWFVRLRGNGGTPDLLASVTDGFGQVTQFSYKGLNDASVYTRGADVAYPKRNLTQGPAVVAQVKTANGLGGWLQSDYTYSGLRRQLQDKSGLGFASVTVTDQSSGIVSATTYSQDDGFVGMPLGVTSTQGAVTLSATTNVLSSFSTAGGASYANVSSSSVISKDLNGAALATRTSTIPAGGVDAYGNVTSSTDSTTDANGETFSTTLAITYSNVASTWLIGLPLTTQVTKTASQTGFTTPAVTRSANLAYDAYGAVSKETVEPGNATYQVVTDYGRDTFGQVNSRTVSWTDPLTGPASRTQSWVYDVVGRRPLTITNAAGHVETRNYDEGSGNVISVLGPNSLTTTWQFDGWGRQTRESRADGTSTSTAWRQCVDSCLNGAKSVRITQEWSGANQTTVPSEEFVDALGRPVLSRSWSFAGTAILGERTYDASGWLQKVSRPHLVGASAIWTEYIRDALGRTTLAKALNQLGSGYDSTVVAYNGLVLTTTNPKTQARSELRNGLGLMRRVTDANAKATDFLYEPFGNLARTVDSKLNQINIGYDRLGRKTSLADPDLGAWTYLVDPVGQTRRQTDAKAQATTFEFDSLGRLTRRLEPDLDSRWDYDLGNRGKGKLYEAYTWVSGAKDYRRVQNYDDLGRLLLVVQRTDWDFRTTYAYDAFGRRDTATHTRSAIDTCCTSAVLDRYVYNAQGYLYQVRASGPALAETTAWEAKTQDAEQRVTREQLGTALITDRTFNAYTGAMTAVASGPNNGAGGATPSHQNDGYVYDSIGNLTSRAHLVATGGALMSEAFTYDNLNRVATSQVGALALKNFGYDELGNLTSKTGVGTYAYPTSGATGVRPHAVSGITGTVAGITNPAFSYDGNGNLLLGLGRGFTWAASNLPTVIERRPGGGAVDQRTDLVYGPDRQRVRQAVSPVSGGVVGAPGTQITYAGAIERERDTATNTTIIRTYLPRGIGYMEERIASITAAPQTTGTATLRYFLKDGLGSVIGVADASGAVLQRLSHDAWGRRRNADGSDDAAAGLGGLKNSQDHSGYTGHEQLDQLALVHMNARVYDPIIGRFVSADPLVPDPSDAQSLNRYSYVTNNPLTYTDPTGLAPYQTNYFTEVGYSSGNVIGGFLGASGGFGAAPLECTPGTECVMIERKVERAACDLVCQQVAMANRRIAEIAQQSLNEKWRNLSQSFDRVAQIGQQRFDRWRADLLKAFPGASSLVWSFPEQQAILATAAGAQGQDKDALDARADKPATSTEPAQPDENNLDKVKGNKAADAAAREAGYDDAHDAKRGRGDSRVNIYNDKTTGQKWIWDGRNGSGKEQL